MQTLTDIFRFTAISHLLVILWLFRKCCSCYIGTGACLFFGVSIVGYLLADWHFLDAYPLVQTPLLVLPFLSPVAFWLFSKQLFDDGYEWRRNWLWLMLGVVTVYYVFYFQNKYQLLVLPQGVALLGGLLTQLISLTFILLGILEAVRNRSEDLVVSRLQFRTVFIAAAALLMAITALTEVSLNGEAPPPLLDVLQKGSIAGLTIFFSVNRLTFLPGFLPEKTPVATFEEMVPAPTAKEPAADGQLLQQLADLMDNQRVWRQEGLTIRQLADTMGVKEYRLRQAINQHLGYRNFSDYLNGYRIREACAKLSDTANREMTVLEISYDLGYASLAPFNKAFKDTTGMTPTEWRRQKRA